MPKYFYSCEECEHAFRAYHGPKERLSNCPQCHSQDSLVRKINKIFIKKHDTGDTAKAVGDLTKEFIEDNRSILKDYKEELKQNEFNDKNIDS